MRHRLLASTLIALLAGIGSASAQSPDQTYMPAIVAPAPTAIVDPFATATATNTVDPFATATSTRTPTASATLDPFASATRTRRPTFTAMATEPADGEPAATHTPTNTPTLTPTATHTPILTPTATEPAPGPCSCSGNLYNCPNFATQGQAQACFDYCMDTGHGDVHLLDTDNDEIACENLPRNFKVIR